MKNCNLAIIIFDLGFQSLMEDLNPCKDMPPSPKLFDYL